MDTSDNKCVSQARELTAMLLRHVNHFYLNLLIYFCTFFSTES